MIKQLMAAFVAAFTVAVHAAPVPLFSVQADTTAVALAQGIADVQSAASPPLTLPITSDAAAVGAIDIATAGAFASLGLLSTSADVTGITGATSGVGNAHFSATFANHGPMFLFIDLDVFGLASGTGFAAATLFVTVTSGGLTLVDEIVTSTTELLLAFAMPVGTTSVLDLLLVSEAGTGLGGAGSAVNVASVAFSVMVPLPATWALLLVAVLAMALVRRRPLPN